MPQPSEFDLQRAVCIWLDGSRTRPPALRPGVVYWHTPNGGKRSAFEAKRFKEMGVKAGIHDHLFLADGRLYGLEYKEPGGGSLSPAQLAMHPRLLAAGMFASAVVDTLADAKACLYNWRLTICKD
jgi:hypothetical protein